MKRLFVHLLVIAGLVLSTISPACAFMAGQGGMIQICGSDGSVKTIQVAEEFDPSGLLKNQKAPSAPGKTLTQQCPFCISFGSMRADMPSALTIVPAPAHTAFIPAGPGSIVPVSAPLTGFSPTGPPEFLFM
jgi:hypothetical protein